MSTVGRCWRGAFSPYKSVKQIPPGEIQAFLREVFEEWGLPERIRADNGHPWGSWNDVPPPLALWLMGLGIEVTWIPARKPQYNGVVERSQGVLQQWAEPETWRDVEEGQARLRWAIQMQRAGYRGQDGKTRVERFPGLGENPRRYRREEEEQMWCVKVTAQPDLASSTCQNRTNQR